MVSDACSWPSGEVTLPARAFLAYPNVARFDALSLLLMCAIQARTVTLPLAIAIKGILDGTIKSTGIVRPTTADLCVYAACFFLWLVCPPSL